MDILPLSWWTLEYVLPRVRGDCRTGAGANNDCDFSGQSTWRLDGGDWMGETCLGSLCPRLLLLFILLDRSLSTGAAPTLVHSFVTNRIDYCLSLYIFWFSICATGLPWPYSALCGTPYWPTTKVQSWNKVYMHDVLRWLPAPQGIEHRAEFLNVTDWRCQLGTAPIYIIDLCRYVSGIASDRSLHSAGRGPHSSVCSYHSHASPRSLC